MHRSVNVRRECSPGNALLPARILRQWMGS
jgi:hypothetical protein